ncbi:MBL fold metallo-hydrolase RNA specificity domain-containing protein [Azospira restricta]|uniref:MBL fold metallo-hydrolase n=1 Tax=Azospira restricta TaxID=404405 RepID=A0A974SSY2_9RHOO|nr:MBL fold metallo-hydrolase [Azospira restricta]QRJ65773.1 MBL fold metallo-hydrolase [Azospira restricta]
MNIQFFGAAGEVTGSCYLVTGPGLAFLVDCGMFQGGPDARLKNLRALPFDVRKLDFVLLTHAHIDHSGLLPRLTMLGYKGPVYTTAATIDLLKVMLLDSAHIQEKDAEWELRHRHRRNASLRGSPQPLYSVTQALDALKHLRPVAYEEPFSPHPEVQVRFFDAGHILGSAIIEIRSGGRRLVFSGDLGQPGRPVINDPTPLRDADVLVVESTYGNRLHRSLQETEDELVAAFTHTLREKRGNIVIPAFAVGRTQELIYVLAGLIRAGRLAPMRLYVDSPMAKAATQITLHHAALLDTETRELIDWQRHHTHQLDVHFVADVMESMALNDVRAGAVILSASGMCEAGRVKYHLRNNLPRPECAVLITGFQAAGTLGRRLVDGARSVAIFGQQVPVRAAIHTIGGLSAHADQAALLGWLRHFRQPPARTYVVHGEPAAAGAFAEAIRSQLGWENVEIPGYRAEMPL